MVDKKKKKEQPCVKCIKKAIEQINAKKKKARKAKKTKEIKAPKKDALQFIFPHLVTSPIPIASIPVAPSNNTFKVIPPSLKVTSQTQTDIMGERGVPVKPTFTEFSQSFNIPKQEKQTKPKITQKLLQDTMNTMGSNETEAKKFIEEQFALGFNSGDVREQILKPIITQEEQTLTEKGLIEPIKKKRKNKKKQQKKPVEELEFIEETVPVYNA
jgi:hypothetical protein